MRNPFPTSTVYRLANIPDDHDGALPDAIYDTMDGVVAEYDDTLDGVTYATVDDLLADHGADLSWYTPTYLV